ncbi:MAG: hypothetical protein H6916_00190 [Novosphingobium sp.]|uniref:hypothetical protein n=1 Tax=Novosphingobium sp. TaxID=1874826 RepID=UPI002611F899|nr:hypothetical protein [Novosphingobium sp.]MCP5385219.1 hypothetical protein [Novosphingobium sp.]
MNSSPSQPGVAFGRLALQIIQRRQLRNRFFDSQFFGEQGWELLLFLFACGDNGSDIETASSALGASPSATMAITRLLVSHALIEQGDSDGAWAEIPITLSALGQERVRDYLEQLHNEGLAA